MSRSALCLAAALGLALGGAPAGAQQGRALGILVTHSVTSGSAADPICTFCGGRDVLAPVSVSSLELEVAVLVREAEGWGLEFPMRAVPFVLVRNNPVNAAFQDSSGRWSMSLETPRGSTVGLGVRPVGLRGWLGSGSVRFQAEVSAGIFRFGSPLFAANATRWNFAYEAAVGVGFEMPRGGRAAVGLRRHHLSNAGLGDVNPGLNSHVVYFGYWIS